MYGVVNGYIRRGVEWVDARSHRKSKTIKCEIFILNCIEFSSLFFSFPFLFFLFFTLSFSFLFFPCFSLPSSFHFSFLFSLLFSFFLLLLFSSQFVSFLFLFLPFFSRRWVVVMIRKLTSDHSSQKNQKWALSWPSLIVCLFTSSPIFLTIYLFIYLLICHTVYLTHCLSICLFLLLSLSVCLSVIKFSCTRFLKYLKSILSCHFSFFINSLWLLLLLFSLFLSPYTFTSFLFCIPLYYQHLYEGI